MIINIFIVSTQDTTLYVVQSWAMGQNIFYPHGLVAQHWVNVTFKKNSPVAF